MYRALILDADDSACFAIQNALKGFGFSFQSFAEPNDALAYAQQTAPDLWFVRIELPSMSGFSVFNKIKRNDATKDIPIILYASDVSEDVFDRHKTLRSKAEGYLKLPVSHEQVVAVVGDILTIDRTALADGREIEVEMTSEIEFDDDIEVVSDEELNGSEDDFDLAAMMDDGDAVDAELSRALGDLTFPDSHETDSQPTTSFGLSDRPQDLSDVAEATQSAVVEAATVAQPDRTLLPPPRSRIAVEPITPTQTESTATAIDSAPVGLASFAAQPDMPSSSVDIEATDNDDLAEASEMAQDDERKLVELAASLERNIETPGGSLNASISTEGTGLGQRREMLNLKAQLVKKDRELLSIRDELETAQRGTLDERRKTRELHAQIGEIDW